MDWFSWLSKSNLDPSLTYEYGLAFTRNELQKEDLVYFNHEFLQSMGIVVAKHRLEILKLARKEVGAAGRPTGISRFVLAINKTKRILSRNFSKWISAKDSNRLALSELSPYPTQWSGALKKVRGLKDAKQEKGMVSSKSTIMRSGPLDMRVHDKLMATNRSISISGPLDGKMQERLMLANWSPLAAKGAMDGRVKDRWAYPMRSPTASGQLDGRGLSPMVNHCSKDKMIVDDGVYSLWSLMFQDMKPT